MDLKKLTIKQLFKQQWQVDWEILRRMWWILLLIILIGGFISYIRIKNLK